MYFTPDSPCSIAKVLQHKGVLRLRFLQVQHVRESPPVLSMWSCTVKTDEENLTYAGLTQGKGFWLSRITHVAVARLVKGSVALCTSKKECNKYDLTAAQCFWSAHHNDWSRWFVISSSPPPICCPSFSLISGVAKEYIKLHLDVKNIFAGSHTEHHWRCS